MKIIMDKLKRIKKCLKKINGDEFEQETGLIIDGWMDSFMLLRLICELEKEFNIIIELHEILPENFDSVEDILIIVNKNGG